MRYPWLMSLFILALAAALPAQEPVITPETLVDCKMLHQWLFSGDPRLVAWAADFARRRHDAQILTEMPDFLLHSSMPLAYGDDEPPAPQGDAIGAVLDALIQESAPVPIRTIKLIAPFFPAQAAILISRLPIGESRLTLQDWTYGATGTWGGRILARIASMMLARNLEATKGMWYRNGAGFVANVVAASEEELRIAVWSDNTVESPGLSGGCGDWPLSEVPNGWPETYTYDLVENDPEAKTPSLVDLDGDRIAFRRWPEHARGGSCNAVAWLDPTTRHRLIAYWLGVRDKEMSWQAFEPFTIKWTDKAAYQHQLGKIIESQREKLHATVEALRERGLMSAGEAKAFAPRLVVTVRCEITPCPLP